MGHQWPKNDNRIRQAIYCYQWKVWIGSCAFPGKYQARSLTVVSRSFLGIRFSLSLSRHPQRKSQERPNLYSWSCLWKFRPFLGKVPSIPIFLDRALQEWSFFFWFSRRAGCCFRFVGFPGRFGLVWALVVDLIVLVRVDFSGVGVLDGGRGSVDSAYHPVSRSSFTMGFRQFFIALWSSSLKFPCWNDGRIRSVRTFFAPFLSCQ